MTNLINRLGFNSRPKSSRNVWLTSLASYLLLGTNYMKLMMPVEIFLLFALSFSAFGLISVLTYSYWTIKEWQTLTSGKKGSEIFYIGLLLFVTFCSP